MTNAPSSLESRILVLAPSRKDGTITEQLLGKAGIPGKSFSTLSDLRKELEEGAGAILLPEEAVFGEEGEELSQWLNTQPAWSDIPVLVLARQGKESPVIARAMESLGNVTVLERPMRSFALVSASHSALRARNRQYQIRDHLLARENAERELRIADERKDEFLATLAHELRNPLSPISHALQIMKLQGGVSEDLDEIQSILERQVGHLVRLVDDLMEVSRITRGKIDCRKRMWMYRSVFIERLKQANPSLIANNTL